MANISWSLRPATTSTASRAQIRMSSARRYGDLVASSWTRIGTATWRTIVSGWVRSPATSSVRALTTGLPLGSMCPGTVAGRSSDISPESALGDLLGRGAVFPRAQRVRLASRQERATLAVEEHPQVHDPGQPVRVQRRRGRLEPGQPGILAEEHPAP